MGPYSISGILVLLSFCSRFDKEPPQIWEIGLVEGHSGTTQVLESQLNNCGLIVVFSRAPWWHPTQIDVVAAIKLRAFGQEHDKPEITPSSQKTTDYPIPQIRSASPCAKAVLAQVCVSLRPLGCSTS
ncbi:hypothetical protein GX51_06049 [Blastomyces parvus]|uniref:Uncharacterized protein n=1 Tax=Blastomyces parvus TaxID=2060905 RepID=A0A2B7WKP8_9EURO|nr:hypothetical protein GX51_06049 [Blastomyces parvus]